MNAPLFPERAPKRRRRHGATKALVVIGDRCPACGSALTTVEAHEEPLLRHGGYGAARRTTTRLCIGDGCGWWLTAEVGEVRPGA